MTLTTPATEPAIPAWRRLVFWILLPVAAVQGLLVRGRALRLPPPPGEAAGSCGEGEPLHLLALGDSIIAGIGASLQQQTLPIQFALGLSSALGRQVKWRIEGENGADLAKVLSLLQCLPEDLHADIILLSVGVNDVTGLSSARQWRTQLRQLIGLLRSRWPGARVLFTGLPPMGDFPLPPQPLRYCLGGRAETLDRVAREVFANEPLMAHIPTRINPHRHSFSPDGFHPSPESYRLWAAELVQRT